MNPLDHHDLPAPALDPARRDAILADVLAEGAVRRTPRHRWLVPVAAAAAVGVVAVGGVALIDRGNEPTGASVAPSERTSASPTRDRQAPRERVEPFVLGPLAAADARQVLDRCLRPYGYEPAAFDVLLAQRVDTLWGPQDAVIAEDPVSGTQFFCSPDQMSMIAGPSSKSVVRVPDAAHPLTPSDVGGTSSSTGPGGTTRHLFTDVGFRVSDRVARVEMRVGTAEEPGTWHSSTPQGGFVYVGAWIETATPAGTDMYVETRAYDVDGQLVASDLLGRSKVDLMPMPGLGRG